MRTRWPADLGARRSVEPARAGVSADPPATTVVPADPPAHTGAPAGLRLRADPGLRVLAGGTILAGGSPVKVLRLTPAGARQVARWLHGMPVPDSPAARSLARRLLDGGLVHPAPAGGPRAEDVTVVIPVRDRHAELACCLAGLRSAACPPPVIVVDDASADPAAIAAITARAGATLIRRGVNGGPGAARNTGLAAARSPLVAFVDSDCVPGDGWLDRLLPHFADPAVGAVAPRIAGWLRPGAGGWLARYEGASSTLDMGSRPSIVRPGARVSYVPGAALVVRRKAAAGGFDASMPVGEDVDFVWRLAAAGWRVRYEPAAVMGHQHRVRLGAWLRRRAEYGTSAAALEARHPGAVRPLYLSWWTAAAWLAVISRHPVSAAVLTGAATALLARRLAPVTAGGLATRLAPVTARRHAADERWQAWRLASRLAAGGTIAAARPVGSAISRTWLPVALPIAIVAPRTRLPLAALVLTPPVLDWLDRRPPLDPVRYCAARLLDDIGYGAGVWRGCLRDRKFQALLPVLERRRGSAPRDS